MARVQIVNVDVEVKKPGARGWSLAKVQFNENGERKWQNVASFSNPQVFAAVQKYMGEEVEVEIGQNDKGYPDWKKVSPITDGSGSAPSASAPTTSTSSTTAPSATRVTGSNYETAVERARRQVLIVRQSSLTAALTTLKGNEPLNPDDVKALAQDYTDWVFDNEDNDGPTE